MCPDAVRNVDLCALMDGECDRDARERIEAELALSPQCADRLALWRRNDAALRFALAGAPSAAIAPPPVASLATDPIFASRPDTCEGGADHRQVLGPRGRLSCNARAATIAAFAGGAGAGAIALAILLLAH